MTGGRSGNLTLNSGLRYEFISPFHEAHNELANLLAEFDPEGNFQSVAVIHPNAEVTDVA